MSNANSLLSKDLGQTSQSNIVILVLDTTLSVARILQFAPTLALQYGRCVIEKVKNEKMLYFSTSSNLIVYLFSNTSAKKYQNRFMISYSKPCV